MRAVVRKTKKQKDRKTLNYIALKKIWGAAMEQFPPFPFPEAPHLVILSDARVN